jgi:hypothetical protein
MIVTGSSDDSNVRAAELASAHGYTPTMPRITQTRATH